MTREGIGAPVARGRPGRRMADLIEADGESGPGFEVTVEDGGRRTTPLIGGGNRIVRGRR
jgi:hypothetical protein